MQRPDGDVWQGCQQFKEVPKALTWALELVTSWLVNGEQPLTRTLKARQSWSRAGAVRFSHSTFPCFAGVTADTLRRWQAGSPSRRWFQLKLLLLQSIAGEADLAPRLNKLTEGHVSNATRAPRTTNWRYCVLQMRQI